MIAFVARFAAKRARRMTAKSFLIQNALEGLDALNFQVSSSPYVILTGAHLSAAERMLTGLQRLLRDLHTHVAQDQALIAAFQPSCREHNA